MALKQKQGIAKKCSHEIFAAVTVLMAVFAVFPVFGATAIYRSVGPGNTTDLAAGSGTFMIAGSTAIFAAAMPANVGVGDAIQYDSNNDSVIDSIAFITSRIDASHFTVENAAGGVPAATAGPNQAWAIYRAYTSLAAARVGLENNGINPAVRSFETWSNGRAAVANNEQWNFACYADGPDTETTDFVWSGWTTGPNNYVRIYTPYLPNEVGVSQRHNGTYTTSGYRIEGSNGNCLLLQNDYIRVEGIQFKLTGASGTDQNELWIENTDPGTLSDFRISDCIFWGLTTTAYGACDGIEVLGGNGGTVKIWNNIFYNFTQPSSAAIDMNDSNFTFYVYNNTAAYCNTGIAAVAGSATVINNLVQGCNTANFSGPAFSAGSGFNASSLPDAPGLNSRQGVNATFVNQGLNDFHLAAGDTAAIGYGTNLSGDPNLSFNDDIDTGARPAVWDIGADQVSTIAVPTPTPVATTLPNPGQHWYAANYCAPMGPMYGANAFVFNNKMWVEGFWNGSVPINSIYFSSDGYIWDTPGSAQWLARYNSGMAVLNNTVYMIGGEGQFGYTNEVWSSTDGINWGMITNSPGFSTRTNCRALAFNGNLWVIGGTGGSDNPGDLQDVWYSADGVTWNEATSSAAWGKRNGESAVVFNGSMWVIGGYSDSASDYTRDAWYSFDGTTWLPATTTAAFSKRSPGGAMAYGGSIHIIGGWNGSGALADVWSSLNGNVWTQDTIAAEFGQRKGQADLVYNNQMWVIGGGNGILSPGCDVWYSPPAGTVTPVPTLTASATPTITPTAAPTASGYIGNQSVVDSTFGFMLNDPANICSYRFSLTAPETVNAVRIYVNSIIGTCPRYFVGIQTDDGTGKPDGNYLPGGPVKFTFTGSSWNIISGFNTPLSAGIIYHLVIKYDNVDADLLNGSNYAFLFHGTLPQYNYIPYNQRYDGSLGTAGLITGSWFTNKGAPEFSLDFADTTSFGDTVINLSNYGINGANSYAELFRVPSGPVQVNRVGVYTARNGTAAPADDLHYTLYDVTASQVLASGVLWTAAVSNNTPQWIDVNLPSAVTLNNTDTYRLVLTSPGSDTSYYYYAVAMRATGGAYYNNLTYDGQLSYLQSSTDTGSTFPTNYLDSDLGFRFSSGIPATFTQTRTPYLSPTFTVTMTATRTTSPTFSYSPTISPTWTVSPTITNSQTGSPTWTVSSTVTFTGTRTPTITLTVTPTNTRTPTPTFTSTGTPTGSGTATSTRTASPTLSATITRTFTFTISQTPTSTTTVTPNCCNPMTMGKTSTGVSNQGSPNYVDSNKYTAAQDGIAHSISIYVYGNPGAQVQVGIYSDSSGPNNLLAVSAATTTIAGWNTITIPDTALTGGVSYWIAMQTQSVLTIAYDTGGATADVSTVSSNSFGSFPNPFGAQATSSELFSMCVNFCPMTCYSPTVSPTVTNTPIATFTGTPTPTSTPTISRTFTPTATRTPSYTATPSLTSIPTSSVSPTGSFTGTATGTFTGTPSPSFTPSQTNTGTWTQTITVSPTNTDSPTPSATQTFTNTYTDTPTFSATSTCTVTSTETYTRTPTPTFTGTPTATPTLTSTPTETYTGTPTDSATITITLTFTVTFTDTLTPLPTNTYTITLTYTPAPTFTNTPTPNINIALDRNYADPGKGDTVKIKLRSSTGIPKATIKVYDLTGELVRKELEKNLVQETPEWYETVWDCRNSDGKTVGRGMYFIYIKTDNGKSMLRVYIIK